MAERDATRGMTGRGAVAAALLAASLAWLPGAAWSQVRQLGPVGGSMGSQPLRGTQSAPIELQGDEPLAQMLILRFMNGHPDLFWRLRGRKYYEAGHYEHARECFELAARYADKPSQAMLGEMHWQGEGGPRDRALGYAWMDLAAERLYEVF